METLLTSLRPYPSRGGWPDQDALKLVLAENGLGIDVAGKTGQHALVAEIVKGEGRRTRSNDDNGGNEQGKESSGSFIHERVVVVTVSNIKGTR